MEVSETLKAIAELLNCTEARQETKAGILFMLETPEQEKAMLDFMLEKDEPPTPEALLMKTLEITGRIETP